MGGHIHLVPLADAECWVELDGYPDRVRHIGWVPGTNPGLVAVADDELTWWAVSGAGAVADSPVSALAHGCAITSLAVNTGGADMAAMVLTGDELGGVRLWSALVPDRPVWADDLGVSVTASGWSRDGRCLLVGCADGRLIRYRVRPGSIA